MPGAFHMNDNQQTSPQPASHNEEPEPTVAREGSSLRTKLLIGLGALVLVGGAATAVVITSNNDAAEKAAEADRVSSLPPQKAYQDFMTPQPTPVSTFAVLPENLAAFEAMSESQFLALPIEERLPYCSFLNNDIQDIATDWNSVTLNPADLLPSSVDASPADKDVIYTYWLRGAIVGHDNTTKRFDKPTSTKAMSCGFADVSSETAQNMFDYVDILAADKQLGFPALFVAEQPVLLASTFIDASITDTVDGRERQQIRMNLDDGSYFVRDIYKVNYVDYLGQPAVTYVG